MSLSRFEYAHGGVKPGQWHQVGGELKAIVRCPTCGKLYSLGKYRVMDGGIVYPALRCPKACGYWEHAVLADWERCH